MSRVDKIFMVFGMDCLTDRNCQKCFGNFSKGDFRLKKCTTN